MSDFKHQATSVEIQKAAGAVASAQFPAQPLSVAAVTAPAAGVVTPAPFALLTAVTGAAAAYTIAPAQFPILAEAQAVQTQAPTGQTVQVATSNPIESSLPVPTTTTNE